MRIPINLASDPFRRDRPMLVASGACAVLLTGLLCVLLFLIVSGRGRVRETRASVDQLNAQLRSISAEQAKLDQFLRQPANAEVLERSVLLNALIDRKSISWTRIFADLEAVLPYNVKLIQVRLPQINSRNVVTLDMTVGATDPLPLINLLKSVSKAAQFGPSDLHTCAAPSQNQPLHQCHVSVDYGQKL
jgi:Tfp pilus assembly protein PilN